MGRKFGVSFSWRRAVGLSALKGRISRFIGVPLTRSGLERKVGRMFLHGIGCLLVLGAVVGGAIWLLHRIGLF